MYNHDEKEYRRVCGHSFFSAKVHRTVIYLDLDSVVTTETKKLKTCPLKLAIGQVNFF